MKIALLGYGKMGRVIESLALETGHQIVFKSTRNTSEGHLESADVAIEFSTPEAAVHNLKLCFEKQIPVVCGTTAWLDHWDEVTESCTKNKGALVYASNFSVGVQIFFELQRQLSKVMSRHPEYKVSIEERHHTQKKDAPSGTAISLAEITLASSTHKNWVLGPARSDDELPIEAIRQPDTPGTHTIYYQSDIDQITIEHKAHSREGFATGALLAAQWVVGKTGIFSMKDVLHLSDSNEQ